MFEIKPRVIIRRMPLGILSVSMGNLTSHLKMKHSSVPRVRWSSHSVKNFLRSNISSVEEDSFRESSQTSAIG